MVKKKKSPKLKKPAKKVKSPKKKMHDEKHSRGASEKGKESKVQKLIKLFKSHFKK
ncbi:hypothetical protein HYT84_04435 [Candidatus Micrarchaeota archaeon]|nr:hypothetical protein [Candidatus Micrarchaeota archaeon]